MRGHLFLLIVSCSIGFLIGLFFPRFFVNLMRRSGVACPSCSVIIIDIDPLRADSLPCWGYSANTMPALCAYADRNMVFTNMHSQSSWTLPSIMSLITSTYPTTHGMLRAFEDVLPANITTMAETFKKAGYHTIFVGVEHEHVPLDKGFGRGFDTVITYRTIADWQKGLDLVSRDASGGRPSFLFLHTFDTNTSWRDTMDPPKQFTFDPTFQAPFIYDKHRFVDTTWRGAIGYLKDHRDLTPEEQTILVSLERAKTLKEAEVYFRQLSPQRQTTIAIFDIYDFVNPQNPAHMRYFRDLFDDRLQKLDDGMKPVFERIENGPLSRRSVVVVTSDHGDEFGEHGKINHGLNLYPSTTHVPMILSVPGFAPAREDILVQSIDIFPTLLGLVGLPSPQSIQGKSFLRANGRAMSTQGDPYVFGAVLLQHSGKFVRSVRSDHWAYYDDQTQMPPVGELYELPTDPGEQRNVAEKFINEGATFQKLIDTTLHEPKN